MSGQSLDYTLTNKTKYEVLDGKLDSIFQKNGSGVYVKANQDNCKLTLELKLKNKSFIRTFEIKTLSINKITLQLFGQKDTFHQTVQHCFSQKNQATLIEPKQSYSRRKETVKVKIEVECLEHSNGIIGLAYILVRGDKCRQQTKNKSISKGSAQKDLFIDAKYSMHYRPGMPKTEKPEIFSERKRNKENKVQKTQQSEDTQLRRALQMSKKEAERSQKKQKNNRIQQKELSAIEQWSNTYNPKPRQYTRIEYQKCKDIFKYVNSAWIQAQRAVEKEKGVIQSQKLSNAIVVRVFHNKIMCVDIGDRQRKAQLQRSCEEMGAKLKKEPEDYCLLITDRLDTQRVAKARKLKGVKILRSAFVTQCKACQTYLDEKQYFFK